MMGMLFGKTSSSGFLPVNGTEAFQLRVSPPLFPYSASGESNWAVFLQLHSLLSLESSQSTTESINPSMSSGAASHGRCYGARREGM